MRAVLASLFAAKFPMTIQLFCAIALAPSRKFSLREHTKFYIGQYSVILVYEGLFVHYNYRAMIKIYSVAATTHIGLLKCLNENTGFGKCKQIRRDRSICHSR